MPHTAAPRFRKHLIALAASAAFFPYAAWAIELSESPPGSVEPYVRPNVIFSIDDSGSMDFRLDQENANGANNDTEPGAGGVWSNKSRRMNVLKYALIGKNGAGGVMRDLNLLPEKKIRLAWQSMNGNNGTPKTLNSGTAAQSNANSMKVMKETHRSGFINFVNSLDPGSSTPSHRMFSQADAYMRLPLSSNGPWATEPGASTDGTYLGCRRTYHIFMTDGRWNGAVSGGSQDDRTKNKTLPDGTVFGSTSTASQPNNKLYADPYADTLADWAFYSWATPLQTSGLVGNVQPAVDYRKAAATENFGTASNPAILERYWNPRYDPAVWPHMVTYTIGFSDLALTWPGAPSISAPSEKVPFGYDGSFPGFVTGSKVWPKMDNENVRSLDLWHAALNGRGRFYAVSKGEDLEKAFREIFGQISTQNTPDLNSSATSGSNVSRGKVGKYTAGYEPTKAWKGYVVAEKVNPDGTTVSEPAWNGKNTADKLDALANVNSRLVLAWSDKWVSTKDKGGVPFKWASDETNLSTAQKLWLQKNVGGTDEGAAKGQQRINYIRGDRSLEGTEEPANYTAAKPFRERKSRQGDIINSDVWYTGAPAGASLLKGYADFVRTNKLRPAMLYVGGNDGLLHGFAAADGEEKIAYVPRGVIPGLTLLTNPQYNDKHKYFVDGSPMTGDIDVNGGIQDPTDPNFSTYSPDWRTFMVGTLALGGKGYFVLDVTNPTITGFAEGNAEQLVKLDRTRGATEAAPNCAAMTSPEKDACIKTVEEDLDIGFITARPVRDVNDAMTTTQITRMNNNRWAVVLGNGYNSTSQRPVLLVQYLDGAKELLRIPVTTDASGSGRAKDNGLAAPRLVDVNGDGRADLVYAGDNLGNLWKFDLTSDSSSNWKVAFGGSPLFTTRGPSALNATTRAKIQPISTAPTVRANDRTMQVGSGSSAKTVRVGGMMVAFGTGRNVSTDDPASLDVQTLYSVLDNTRYKEVSTLLGKRLEVHPGGGTCPGASCVPTPAALGVGVAAAKLAQQKFTEVTGTDYSTVDVVDELKNSTWSTFNGWYLDLPAVGERLLKPMEFYDASNLLTVWSQVPAKGSNVDANVETCDSTAVDDERQYRSFVNIMDGKKPSVQIVDMNGDGNYNPITDMNASRSKVAKGPHSILKQGTGMNIDINAKNEKEGLAPLPEETLRPSWRQVR